MSLSADKNNLVNDIMQQLEQHNGTYNEDIGDFTKKSTKSSEPQLNLTTLQQQFLSIIDANQGLRDQISRNHKYQQIINDILEHEEYLTDLLRDPSITPKVITSILKESDDEEEVQREQPQKQQQPIVKPLQEQKTMSLSIEPAIVAENESRFSWSEFLSGPLIAITCYFLVTNTPLIYYIGQVPYVGELLVSNNLVVSMLLVGVLYILLSVALDFSGLI